MTFSPRIPIILLCMFSCALTEAHAQKLTAMNLERLVDQAGIIFAGKVVGIESDIKSSGIDLQVTHYTFEVLDPVYGTGVSSDTICITQYGGESHGRSFYPHGVPRFERGEEVVVMFYPPSKVGLTSPVGKEQGKFLISVDDSAGTWYVMNTLNNSGLFRRLRHPDQVVEQSWLNGQPDGPLEYDRFLRTLKNLVGVLKGSGT